MFYLKYIYICQYFLLSIFRLSICSITHKMASGLLLAPSGDALKITRKRKSASLWSQSPTTDTDDLYLPQEELHKYLPLLRQRAIEYLSELVNSEQENNRHDPFLWGDEVRFLFIPKVTQRTEQHSENYFFNSDNNSRRQ